MIKYIKYLLALLILTSNYSFAQIKVTSLPQNQNGIFDQNFYGGNEFRYVQLLNSDWYVYSESDPEKRVFLSVPAAFEGEQELIFEKKIFLTSAQIQNSQVILGFLGINYSAEISLNGYNIYKYAGGSFPFEVALPKDILKEHSVVTVKINRKLNSESSIPVLQSFLLPNSRGGIFREVYLKILSPLYISSNSSSYSFDQSLTKAYVNFNVGIENSAYQKSGQSSPISVHINLIQNGSIAAKGDFTQTIYSENNQTACRLELPSLLLWSPQSPNYYLCEVSLIKDGRVIDKTVSPIAFFHIQKDQDKLLLNKSPFAFQGTTYYLDETSLRRTVAYQKIKDDLTLIKNTGFNSVRFAKSYPNPYALKVCQELGLFAFIELPINSIPEEILSEKDFQLNTVNLIKDFTSSYSAFANTILIGTGSSFLPNSEITQNFISNLSAIVKGKGFLTYASFVGGQTKEINHLDFYGIELYSSSLDGTQEQLKKSIESLKASSIFISEVSYPNYKGDLRGYLAKNSSDAQAKYFSDVINLARELNISGFMINSLFDYSGAFASLYGGYNYNNIYKFGVLESSQNLFSTQYKVLNTKLTTNAKVTIPIGSRRDDNPLIFIFLALFLSIIMAVLINTKKKFKEDCTRALLRPYNFFADIRDHRIISGLHTAILMLIQAGSISLLFTVLFFYLRSNILMEKIFLSFGSHTLMKLVSYISWNPEICSVLLFFVALIKFMVIGILIKVGSFFIKTKVEFTSILFGVIWTFLPFTLLLPVELVLFKILAINGLGSIVLIILLLFLLWILQRLIKCIYVIFDTRPIAVYFYSFLVIIILVSGILFKFQLSNSTLYYISNAIKQYQVMIF